MDYSEFTDAEVKAVTEGASRAYSVLRHVVELGDCQQEAWLWVTENIDKVRKWRDAGKRTDRLRNSAYHAALSYGRSHMQRRGGTTEQDFVTYSTGYVAQMLPVLFAGDSFNTGNEVNDEVKHTTAPNEGGNGLATLMDIRRAFKTLGNEQKKLLFILHSGTSPSYEQVAKDLDVSSMTVRRREQRALEQIVDNLGGPRVEARRKERQGDLR